MPAHELQAKAAQYGLKGNSYPTVQAALQAARGDSAAGDLIFVGGSCFIVADLLSAANER